MDSDECKLDDECAIELSKGKWKRLAILYICGNEIGNRGLRQIRFGNWPKLHKIYLSITLNSLNALRYIASSNWKN
jgi:hypothetical protein